MTSSEENVQVSGESNAEEEYESISSGESK